MKKVANEKAHSIDIPINSRTSALVTSSVLVSTSIGGQPSGSIHQLKFSGTQPEMTILEPSCPLPTYARVESSQACSYLIMRSVDLMQSASFLSFMTLQRGFQSISQLSTEFRKSNGQRELLAKQWNDAQSEIS
uniref:Uncharacterized protein n=1 Tax=Cannabis sativa TaxID=3483 RepID=A0A803PJ04_CANSA